MLFDAIALDGAAEGFGALTEFGAADFCNRLAGLSGLGVMDDAEARAAFSEERRKALENVVDHDESERLGSESVFLMCRA